jgi:Arc/MetJ-type ribon-helix-helix transcriptional regulator
MTLTLDAQLEQQIQREIELGHGRNAVEVIKRALDLTTGDSWSNDEETELDARLEHSMAAARRGELYTPEEARQILADRRAARGQ